jgi:uncharacterized membrane protein YgdD (TMEM256/DUF423 family)
MKRGWLAWGALLGFLAVATGALGDHWIRARLPEWFPDAADKRIGNWEVASRYLFFHALAICALGLLPGQVSRGGARLTGWLFTIGVCLFSGGLFALALTNQAWLAQVVPVGGVSLMFGWVALFVAILRADRA